MFREMKLHAQIVSHLAIGCFQCVCPLIDIENYDIKMCGATMISVGKGNSHNFYNIIRLITAKKIR